MLRIPVIFQHQENVMLFPVSHLTNVHRQRCYELWLILHKWPSASSHMVNGKSLAGTFRSIEDQVCHCDMRLYLYSVSNICSRLHIVIYLYIASIIKLTTHFKLALKKCFFRLTQNLDADHTFSNCIINEIFVNFEIYVNG